MYFRGEQGLIPCHEIQIDNAILTLNLAGKQGFEPRFYGPEPYVLPLDDFPIRKFNATNILSYLENVKPKLSLSPLTTSVK
jgi:hypothetical protein